MAFKFLVAVYGGKAFLCEGGVYTDDIELRRAGHRDYSGNCFGRAAWDCERLNESHQRSHNPDRTPYELRDTLDGVDCSDVDVRASLVGWQIAALEVTSVRHVNGHTVVVTALDGHGQATPNDFLIAVYAGAWDGVTDALMTWDSALVRRDAIHPKQFYSFTECFNAAEYFARIGYCPIADGWEPNEISDILTAYRTA